MVGMGKQRNAYEMFWEDLMRREYLEETGMVAKATSQRIFKKCIIGRLGMIYEGCSIIYLPE